MEPAGVIPGERGGHGRAPAEREGRILLRRPFPADPDRRQSPGARNPALDCRICLLALVLLAGAVVVLSGCTSVPGGPAGTVGTATPGGNGTDGALQVTIQAEPSRYAPYMSTTVGIRLAAVNASGILPPDSRFTWETDYGTFLQWGLPSFRVEELGPRPETGPEPVYWSFRGEPGEGERRPVHISLHVRDPSTGAVLAGSGLNLTWENPITAVVEGAGETTRSFP